MYREKSWIAKARIHCQSLAPDCLLHLCSWRRLLPCPKILAVDVLLRRPHFVHERLVVNKPGLEVEGPGCQLGLSKQGAATL